ncbi:MAG: hypothetical protein AB1422_05205 [bacterium]
MLDYLGIIDAFDKAEIKYIIVGGMAVNLHGIPRMTYDLDLLLDLEDENLSKFLNLLKEWGYKPKVPVDIMDFANQEKRNDWIKNKNMKAFNLVNEESIVREIDVIIDSPVSYIQAKNNIKYVKLYHNLVPVIGLNDLIMMKKNTGRKQDEADIRYLEVKLGKE